MSGRGAGSSRYQKVYDMGYDEAEKILRRCRSSDMDYIGIERRSIRGKYMVLCYLCNSTHHSEEDMKNHLDSEYHSQSLKFAISTMMKTNPWPFDDGRNFYHGQQRAPVGDVPLPFVGYGRIARRIVPAGETVRIWCEYLDDENPGLPNHELALVVQQYCGDNTAAQFFHRCSLCLREIYAGRDGSWLLNNSTGRKACIHQSGTCLFHTSCLLSWILHFHAKRQTLCCPECFGIGSYDRLPAGHASKSWRNFEHLSILSAGSCWREEPEVLENCTFGLTFKENLVPLPYYEQEFYGQRALPDPTEVVEEKTLLIYRYPTN